MAICLPRPPPAAQSVPLFSFSRIGIRRLSGGEEEKREVVKIMIARECATRNLPVSEITGSRESTRRRSPDIMCNKKYCVTTALLYSVYRDRNSRGKNIDAIALARSNGIYRESHRLGHYHNASHCMYRDINYTCVGNQLFCPT